MAATSRRWVVKKHREKPVIFDGFSMGKKPCSLLLPNVGVNMFYSC